MRHKAFVNVKLTMSVKYIHFAQDTVNLVNPFLHVPGNMFQWSHLQRSHQRKPAPWPIPVSQRSSCSWRQRALTLQPLAARLSP